MTAILLSSDNIVEVISSLNNQYKPEIILIGRTKLRKEVAPRIAQISGVDCATDYLNYSIEKGDMIVKHLVLGGRFLETIRILLKPPISTLHPGRFEKKVDKTRKSKK